MSAPPSSPAAYAEWLFRQPCVFERGVMQLSQLIHDGLPEVAFVGRSNVGKSSLLNALMNHSGIARVSNTPGRTREMNLFNLGGRLRLVDLPGYGFAASNPAQRQHWDKLIPPYLSGHRNLSRVVQLIDGRHGFKDSDMQMLNFLFQNGIPLQIVLTKADKKEATAKVADGVRRIAQSYANILPEVLSTSSEKGAGLKELRESLAALTPGT